MALLDGVQNFTPAFAGRELALREGAAAAGAFAQGMNIRAQRQQLGMQRERMDLEEAERQITLQQLDAFKRYTEEGGMPTDSLGKANHIINRLTSDPSWLANPRTADAANAVFSSASKVIGINLQMERLKNSSIAAQTKQKLVEQMATMAEEIAKANPSAIAPFFQQDQNGNLPISDVSNFGKLAELHKQNVVATSGAPATTQIITAGGQKVDVAYTPTRWEIVPNPQDKLSLLKEQLGEKEASQLFLMAEKRAIDLEAEAAGLEKSKYDSDKRRAAELRESAKTYKALSTSLGRGPSATPPATTPQPTPANQSPIQLPKSKSDLIRGQVYSTSRGNAVWDGEKFIQQ